MSTLETGAVIVQYRDPRNRGRLERLAADDVVVAPNPDLPHEVVATGWLRKRVCSNVDVKALSEFIGAVRGRYATHITTTTRAGD